MTMEVVYVVLPSIAVIAVLTLQPFLFLLLLLIIGQVPHLKLRRSHSRHSQFSLLEHYCHQQPAHQSQPTL